MLKPTIHKVIRHVHCPSLVCFTHIPLFVWFGFTFSQCNLPTPWPIWWSCEVGGFPQHTAAFSATVINENSNELGPKMNSICRCWIFLKNTYNLQYNKIRRDIIPWKRHKTPHSAIQNVSKCLDFSLFYHSFSSTSLTFCLLFHSFSVPPILPSHSQIKVKNISSSSGKVGFQC